MCGFLGEFSFNSTITTESNDFLSLLELSKHRGPDSTQTLKENNYQLGFNRLAILDVSANGNQPKYSPSKRYVVIFNGEIYNYKTLQKEHQLKGLQSTSDTEVLIHLLDRFGIEKTVKMLNGMFAIAIIDKVTQTVSLVRDFAGIKPLFYGLSASGIVFASQFNQIFKHSWHCNALKLRPDMMKAYFGFGFMHAPNTIYKDIFQVRPGEMIQISLSGEICKKTYLEFSKHINVYRTKSCNTSYSEILKAAVNKQLASDVPLASFLSGGIDSPLITAVAKSSKTDIKAFTFGINNSRFDESKKAIAYAAHLNISHVVENVNEADILSNIETHFRYVSEPFGDYSSIPTYLITKKTRESHTVMLSGDGGDELFFGYPRMLDVLNQRHWFRIPFFIRRPLIAVLNRLKLTNTWGAYTYRFFADWITSKQLYIPIDVLNTFFSNVNFSDEVKDLFALSKFKSKRHLLHWLRWNEFYGHLQRVLIKVDRTSMANSLEVRVPFLDKNSINYAWNDIPLQLESANDLKKGLKDDLAAYYPKEYIETQKKGFSVPIESWLRNELKDSVEDYILNKPFYGESFINVNKIKSFIIDFYKGRHNNGWGVWHVYAWQKWAYTHVIEEKS
ncbi:asparagine synthase (glutamine-hydrolysing) [Winogradskyella wandonensis]|uniref:asparagine synthase (glutamine-hydrolyzing) n=1 Tax=Winogradskyella wandonensis TaxID=1442586 RepID=A0A4R1KUF2_9FLAO|nr:asparagine synthase (glutamine-hydrolyzing) [Winogradskyella wandonensis]TCK68822.1 asparagine synthase (glutamine-hydrolysing) [Winogradskyella wandonensis]